MTISATAMYELSRVILNCFNVIGTTRRRTPMIGNRYNNMRSALRKPFPDGSSTSVARACRATRGRDISIDDADDPQTSQDVFLAGGALSV